MARTPRMRVVVAAVLLAIGCQSQPQGDGRIPPPLDTTYPDGADGLKKLWSDILRASIRDDRERVHTLMASLIMSDDDLIWLFGDELGRKLQPRYVPMVSRLVNVGAMELVAQVSDRKYDDVEVFLVDEKGSDADRATLRALKAKVPVYGVRVKKKEQSFGLRYDFFVYRNGHWVTGNQLAKYLIEARDGGMR